MTPFRWPVDTLQREGALIHRLVPKNLHSSRASEVMIAAGSEVMIAAG
jgi:hypothetical protein